MELKEVFFWRLDGFNFFYIVDPVHLIYEKMKNNGATCCTTSKAIPERHIATAFSMCRVASTVGFKYSGGSNTAAIVLLTVASNVK